MLNSISYLELFEDLKRIKVDQDKCLVSIIIPVWNEEKTIFSLLNNLPYNDLIEVIVIDDQSTDYSVFEVQRAQKSHNIKLYRHKKNKGYGEAILSGVQKSNGKIIITMDADGQHRPEDLYELIKPILDGKADFTIGSRYLGSYVYKLPISTRLGEIFVEKMILLLFGVKVVNNQGGFRAFDRKVIRIFDNIQFKKYAFTTELIIRAKLFKYRIKECPITLLDRKHGKSKIILNKLALNIFFLLLKYMSLKIKMKIFNQKEVIFKKNNKFFKEIS